MAAGLAVAGSNLPGISRIVQTYRNGVLVDGMSPVEWAASFDALAQMPCEDLDAMRERSVIAAKEHSWERQRVPFLQEVMRALD
jgi:glycosyltransferase involved in cell wall biosynthesis